MNEFTKKEMYREIARTVKLMDDRGLHFNAARLARLAYWEWNREVSK